MTIQKNISVIIICLFSFLHSEPFSEFKVNKNYSIQLTNMEIEIDGILDDSIWADVPSIDDFLQLEPNIFDSPSYRTSVKMVQDKNYLYIAAQMFDNFPENISAQLCRKDDWMTCFEKTSDWISIALDSFHDHKSGYVFVVNAAGVQVDAMIYDDSDYDGDWNAIWLSQVNIHEKGWDVEMKIPISTFPFHLGMDWGLNITRYIHYLNEENSWVVLPRHLNSIASKFGHIIDISSSVNTNNLQLKPYFLLGNSYFDNLLLIEEYKTLDDDSFTIEELNNETSSFGLDIRYRVSPNTTLNATVNPDFGQIESDPETINLSAYETFFEEKRPFFLENASIFDLPINIFYSRRVGEANKIDWASRLISKNNNGLTYATIFAKEKNKSIFVDRIVQDILEGSSLIGLTRTSVEINNANYRVLSVDGVYNLLDNNLLLDNQIIISDNPLSIGKGLSSEISMSFPIIKLWSDIEYFDEFLDIDKSGYLKRNNLKKFKYGIKLRNLNPGTYLRRGSIDLFHDYQTNLDNNKILDRYGLIIKSLSMNYNQFILKGFLSKAHCDDYLTYDYELDLFGPIVRIPMSYSMGFEFITDNSKLFSVSSDIEFTSGDDDEWKYTNQSSNYSITLTVKPLNYITSIISLQRSNIDNALNFIETIPDDDEINHHIFSHINGFNDTYTFRIDGSISNKISVQCYAEYYHNNYNLDDYRVIHENELSPNIDYPIIDSDFFLGEGDYEDYDPLYFNPEDVIDEANHEEFEESFLDPNHSPVFYTKYTNMNFNFVLKWEFRQGSDLFLVFTKTKGVNGKTFDSIMDFFNYDEMEDYNEIYNDMSIHLKLNYWFNI